MRLTELWPRTPLREAGAQAGALYKAGTLELTAGADGTLWVSPRLCNGLLPKFLAGKITAAAALRQEEANCAVRGLR